MKFSFKSALHGSVLLLATLVFMGQQRQATQNPAATGAALLEEAAALENQANKCVDASQKYTEAAEAFRIEGNWTAWGDAYESAYQCALKCGNNGIFKQLLPIYQLAATHIKPNEAQIPPYAKAVVWGRIAFLYHQLGEYEEAVKYYEIAIPFAEDGKDPKQLMRYYGNAARVFWTYGDDHRSIKYSEKALDIALQAKDTVRLTPILINLADAWRTLDPPKSFPYYFQALSIKPDYALGYLELSKAYLEMPDSLAKALNAAHKSFSLASDDVEKTDALHQLGRVCFAQKKYATALEYYNKARVLALTGYGPNQPEYAKIAFYQGNALCALGQFENALNAYNTCLSDLLPAFKPSQSVHNPQEEELNRTSLWIIDALKGKADTYRQYFAHKGNSVHLDSALICAELALLYGQTVKLRYGEEESKFELGSSLYHSYETALHTAFDLYRLRGDEAYLKRAFALAEQSKAVVLAEALYRKEVKKLLNVPEALMEQEKDCHARIAQLERSLMNADEQGLKLYKDSLFTAIREKEKLEQQILQDYPAYGAALFAYKTAITPDTVAKQLPAECALLEYFAGDSSIFTFLIAPEGFYAEELDIPAGFNRDFSRFLRSVNDWKLSGDSAALASDMFLEHGQALYGVLLKKMLDKTRAKRIFIVPDGKLGILPFELLSTKTYVGSWIDRDVPLLIKERTISYRFSARPQKGIAQTPQKGWGGFGLEYDDHTLSQVEQGETQGLALRNSGKLPFADDEIMAISGLLGGAFWLNKEATKENFFKHAGQYGVLHLAMHGFVDENNPLRSRLLFSRATGGEDSHVYAADLYNLQLKAGLSVLSACQSGTGAWKKGEGIMSLARAFAFAGCPSMVMSLWNVSDESTSALMLHFYRQLHQGANKDEALRQAKLQYLSEVSPEYAKPVYWGSFVPIGEMEALGPAYLRSTPNWLLISLGVIVSIVIFIFLFNFIKNKNLNITKINI